jgi:hypothetical protein
MDVRDQRAILVLVVLEQRDGFLTGRCNLALETAIRKSLTDRFSLQKVDRIRIAMSQVNTGRG